MLKLFEYNNMKYSILVCNRTGKTKVMSWQNPLFGWIAIKNYKNDYTAVIEAVISECRNKYLNSTRI